MYYYYSDNIHYALFNTIVKNVLHMLLDYTNNTNTVNGVWGKYSKWLWYVWVCLMCTFFNAINKSLFIVIFTILERTWSRIL